MAVCCVSYHFWVYLLKVLLLQFIKVESPNDQLKNIPYIKVMNRKCPQNLQFLLRNGLKAPQSNKKKEEVFWVFALHSGGVSMGGSVAVGVTDMWYVKGDTRHLTPDTWYLNLFHFLSSFFYFSFLVSVLLSGTRRECICTATPKIKLLKVRI